MVDNKLFFSTFWASLKNNLFSMIFGFFKNCPFVLLSQPCPKPRNDEQRLLDSYLRMQSLELPWKKKNWKKKWNFIEIFVQRCCCCFICCLEIGSFRYCIFNFAISLFSSVFTGMFRCQSAKKNPRQTLVSYFNHFKLTFIELLTLY